MEKKETSVIEGGKLEWHWKDKPEYDRPLIVMYTYEEEWAKGSHFFGSDKRLKAHNEDQVDKFGLWNTIRDVLAWAYVPEEGVEEVLSRIGLA